MEKKFCIQCGREILNSKHGSTYCRKHGYQMKKYGHCLDSNPRCKFDPNEFRFVGNDVVEFDTYNTLGDVVSTYIIDAKDYPIVSKYKWVTAKNGYAVVANEGISLHRLLMNAKIGQQVDHININILDNRKENLRICGNSLNSSNRKPYNKLNIKGVEYHKSQKKFSAYLRVNNKQYHSPCYYTKEEAMFARFILEQLFLKDRLTQFTSEYINTLTVEQKSNIINGIKIKFNVE